MIYVNARSGGEGQYQRAFWLEQRDAHPRREHFCHGEVIEKGCFSTPRPMKMVCLMRLRKHEAVPVANDIGPTGANCGGSNHATAAGG